MTIGTDFATSGNWAAYCFAEIAGYSKIGSYTGNGSAGGPFVYCGFRPRYLLIKRVDIAANWFIHDSAREQYNGPNAVDLFPNGTSAETADANRLTHFMANGFNVKGTFWEVNASGGTYIFYAIAEAPFQYSLAR